MVKEPSLQQVITAMCIFFCNWNPKVSDPQCKVWRSKFGSRLTICGPLLQKRIRQSVLLHFRQEDISQNLAEMNGCGYENLTVTQIIAVEVLQIYKLLELLRRRGPLYL